MKTFVEPLLVGVPEITPSVDSDNPGGSIVSPTISNVYGGVPPNAHNPVPGARLELNGWPITPACNEVPGGKSDTGVTIKVCRNVLVAPIESVTTNSMSYVPTVAMAPVST